MVKKASKKKEARIKTEILKLLQQASYRDRDRNDEILDFDLVFVGLNNTDLNVIFCCAGCF